MSYVIPDPRWEEPRLLIPGLKPVGNVVIDWDHPMARGLVSCVIGGLVYDLASGLPLIYTGHEFLEILDSSHGKYISAKIGAGSPGGTKYIELDGTAGLDLTEFTLLAEAQRWVSSGTGGFFGNFAGTANNILIRIATATPQMYVRDSLNAQYGAATSVSMAAVEVGYHLAFRRKDFTLQAFTDGVGGTPVSSGSSSLVPTTNLRIGSGYSSSQVRPHTKEAYVFLYDRGLSEFEMASMRNDPYQFLIPA